MLRKKVKGYLTIYLSLTLTVMLSLCLTLIEGARRSSVRLEAECVMDIGLNSILAEYHRELFQQYNLFYIDSSYGSAYPSYYNTEARLNYYLEQNIQEEDCYYVSFLYKDLLSLELKDVQLQKVAVATDADGLCFQRKAASVVWDDVGLGLVERVVNWVSVVENNDLMEQDIQAAKKAVDNEIAEIVEKEADLTEEKWISIEVKNPTEHINNMMAQGTLKWVLSEPNISGQVVDLSQYISARRRRGSINSGNATAESELSVAEKILFHEYLLRYAGYYGQEKEGSLLKYQVEYLLGGKDSDAENLSYTASVLCGIRGAANAIYLYGDAGKKGLVETIATVLSAAMMVPELEPLLETTLILGWAYVESLYDTKVLLAGGKVPLLKDDASWHYDLDSILESVDMQVRDEDREGLAYTDYLHVLLYLTDTEKVTFRFMDLIEMDIRKTEGNADFRMDGCIDYMEAQAVFRSGSGYQYKVKTTKSYE